MAGDNCVCDLASCRTREAVDNGGKSLCKTWSLSLVTAENNFLSAERQISAKAGRSGGTKRLQ